MEHRLTERDGAVERALGIMGLYLDGREELRVADFARGVGLHRSTASRIAATLEERGFLQRVGGARDGFRLGPIVAQLGVIALGGRGWAEVARPSIIALADETGETAVLSIAAGHDAVDVLQETSRCAVGATSWVGRRTPLHATSDGKVLLAFGAGALPADRLLESLADGTITDRAALEEQLEAVRSRGHAVAIGEAEAGLNGVAVPIVAADGRCVAALSLSGPDYRLPAARLAQLAPRCRAAVDEIARALRWDHRPEERR